MFDHRKFTQVYAHDSCVCFMCTSFRSLPIFICQMPNEFRLAWAHFHFQAVELEWPPTVEPEQVT